MPKWKSYDCDILTVSNKSYNEFKDFLVKSHLFKEETGVTGGKYGFAIFVKQYGPKYMQKMSLGKISQLV